MQHNSRWNLNPFVVDIELKAFMSHISNIIKRKKGSNFYTWKEMKYKLVLRDKYSITILVVNYLQRLKADP